MLERRGTVGKQDGHMTKIPYVQKMTYNQEERIELMHFITVSVL